MKTYEISAKTQGQLEQIFNSHPPGQDHMMRFEKIIERLSQAARFLCTLTPECREQTLMLDKIQEVKLLAIESIAKNEK